MASEIYLDNTKRMTAIGKALSSEVRLSLLTILSQEQLNVNELAKHLGVPASSAAMHVRVLEEAGLIRSELKPGVRGSMKVCIKQEERLLLHFSPKEKEDETEVISMPIGNYVDYKVEPTCGIVNEMGHIDDEDEPRCFYNPDRTSAKLLWFGDGYVEYRFSNAGLQNRTLKSMEFSAELCSEAMDYDLDYPSDITLWINGLDAGTWICPSDFGGRRGKLNPDWWPDKNSQYGNLKTWRLDENGTFIDGKKVNEHPLSYYQLSENPFISVKLGISKEAEHIGGINIFGDCFGDHPQDILLKFNYKE